MGYLIIFLVVIIVMLIVAMAKMAKLADSAADATFTEWKRETSTIKETESKDGQNI